MINISRRKFLALGGAAGLGLAGAAWLNHGAWPDGRPVATPDPMQQWLREVGGAYAGRTLRIATERTPLALALAQMTQNEFEPLTGIDIDWQLLPLPDLYRLANQQAERATGDVDIVDVDATWLAELSPYLLDLERQKTRANLALPGFDWADLTPQLMSTLASDGARIIGLPFDVPVYVLMYRRDIFEKLNLQVPDSIDAYARTAQHIAKSGLGSSGAIGQWAAGHYSSFCDFSSWLWAHGGAFFDRAGRSQLNSPQARATADYMLSLQSAMPAAAMQWNWWDASEAMMRGEAAMGIFWNSFVPEINAAGQSSVAGLVETAACPVVAALPQAACSFGEKPGIARHGGSVLSILGNSQQRDAAWVFLQWATSKPVAARASMDTGSTPIRDSIYTLAAQDPALKHFGSTRQVIQTQLGSEPRLSGWSALVADNLADELGRMLLRQQTPTDALAHMSLAANALVSAR